MKIVTILTLCLYLTSLQGCKKECPDITKTHELSNEMKAYFVNYEVGTKWIYQDTMNPNVFDTIELISKESFDVDNGSGTVSKGFVLYYKPKKSKDFKMRVNPGRDNSCYVKIDPMVSAAGSIVFENYDGVWAEALSFHHSMEIKGHKYYSVIQSPSSNSFVTDVSISESNGIISFWKYAGSGWGLESFFILIKTIKP